MPKRIVSTDNAPQAIGPYSQAVAAAGRFLFISGQIPLTPSGELVTGPIEDQTRQVMKNLAGVLQQENLGFEHVVKTTILLRDMADFAAVNAIYGEAFPHEKPARATYATAGLPKDADIEIEAIACYPDSE